ncbi:MULTISPECIES: carbohydrate ABC transporter permease [unclassified Chelatococcus]|uniref:carbohydrate ABC transporter permease n=1 Tax=unclassified Chelatococcus TaxID=2638111 RepID=UPI001BCC7EE7|nr:MULTISPECIES: carbohydrate ABC transporter permease [unclassified Chelatococcus]MBS7700586.1 carbohydrate ABC transporter permease [Chelatococcus sp. YT9]MBX3558701.1 carbohydrate ABC transporter permease [Chelatococcus sp.]
MSFVPEAPASTAWRRRVMARRLGRLAVNGAIAIIALFPILWGLSSSLKPSAQIAEYPPSLLPRAVTFEHYLRVFNDNVGHYIFNSALVSTGAVALCLIVGALGGYALARFTFRGRGVMMVMTVAIMSIPIASLLVPTFTTLSTIGLIDTRLGLILLYAAYQLPIVIWMLYGYFLSLPVEIEQAARIDGCSPYRTLRKVVLPLSRPGLVAAALFVLVFSWNDFVVAVTMTSSEQARTLPVAIYFYLGFYGREWGPLLAASIISIIPIIGVFIVLQRYFMSGLTGGGVKG